MVFSFLWKMSSVVSCVNVSAGSLKWLAFFFPGLPSTGSWQDIKDHMREAGDVCYADVYKDGTGVVEFLRYEDMKYAVRKLDDSKFRSHEVCFSRIYCICRKCVSLHNLYWISFCSSVYGEVDSNWDDSSFISQILVYIFVFIRK